VKTMRLAALGLVLAAVAGCSDDTAAAPEVPAMFKAEIDNILRQGDPSDLEREVLADYRVSDSEVSEARDAYSACMEGFGLEADFGDGSGFAYGATPDSQDSFAADYEDRDVALEKVFEVADECTVGTILNIGWYYVEMAQNPEGLTVVERIRGCLESTEGNPAAGLSDEELSEALGDEEFLARDDVVFCYGNI
jgi:hypothetical protein